METVLTLGAFELEICEDRLQLRKVGSRSRPFFIDFCKGKPLSHWRKQMTRSQLLVRAMGKSQSVLDVTAGFGQDAFFLAVAGFQVTAWERSEIIYRLLQNGFERLMKEPSCANELGSQLQFIHADSLANLRQPDLATLDVVSGTHFALSPDVVYMDPMYPERKKSALPSHEMIWLREIVGADPDSAELFEAAKRVAKRRVVVKRPLYAEPIQALGLTHQLRGRTTRYDIYEITRPF